MIFLYVFLGILLFLLFCPFGLRLRYDEKGFFMGILIGPFGFGFPHFEKKKKPEKPKKSKEPPKNPAPVKKSTPKGGRLKTFLPYVPILKDLVGSLRRKLTVSNIVLHLTLCGEDPCDLAVLSGKAWAGMGTLSALLERSFRIKHRDLQVFCDFEGTECEIYGLLELRITLAGGLSALFGAGFRFLKMLYHQKSERTVQNHE